DLSIVRDLRGGRTIALAAESVQRLDLLWRHPALFTARLPGLGSWRNLSRLRQRHRSGRRNRLRDLAGSDFGRDRLAARPSEKQYARQRLVSCNHSSLHKSIVIPGKLAIASATRNPGISNTSGYRLSP